MVTGDMLLITLISGVAAARHGLALCQPVVDASKVLGVDN